MDSQERKIIDELFDKLAQAEQQAGPREPGADAHIRSRIEKQPGAPYLMAQTIVMQQQALEAAQARITALEDEVARRPASGGFLSGLFGGGADRTPGGARSTMPQSGAGQLPGQGIPQAGFGQSGSGFGRDGGAGFGRSGAGVGRGGGFLAGAAQTAMGVAGGMLLGSMIGSAFGGGEAHAATPATPASPEPASLDDTGNASADEGFGNVAGDEAMDFGDEEI
jgi:hypothetical protein